MIIDLTDGAHVPTGSPGAELVDRATTDLPSGIETVVLVSGDGDFVPLVMQQQSRGLKVVVLSWRRSLSLDLAAAADDHVLLEDHLELAA